MSQYYFVGIFKATYGADVYSNSVSHSLNGAVGKITVKCKGYPMTAKTLVDIDSAHCNPTVTGIVSEVTYLFSASTTKGDIFIASGTINSTL